MVTYSRYHYTFSRQGIYEHAGEIIRGKRVLLPAYTCADFVGLFRMLNCDIYFLKIDETLNFVEGYQLWPEVDFMVLTHYMGYESPVDDVKKYMAKTKCMIIEDNAHAVGEVKNLVNIHNNDFHFEIVSYRKAFQLEAGAVINVRSDVDKFGNPMVQLSKLRLPALTILKIKAVLRSSRLINRIRIAKFSIFGLFKNFKRFKKMRDIPLKSLAPSNYNNYFFEKKFDRHVVRSREKQIRSYLKKLTIKQIGRSSHYDEIPFAILVSTKDRAALLDIMKKFNVNIFPWPEIDRDARNYLTKPMLNTWAICLL